ncbi:MAG: hypothetical protein IKZ99_00095 [Salinivirgaceae bacterium]|nr:hypothetical protein [Salinivirgaceae bacterium]
MGQRVTTFADGSYLEYDTGQFDNWCVYLTRPGNARYAPRDYQYFARLVEYGKKYGNNLIYNDFVQIYEKTTKTLDSNMFSEIVSLCTKFGADQIGIAIDFSIIYMGMIAEENKEHSILGKRIKRLGVYQVLIENYLPNIAANFSRGKKWRELAVICKERGF